jgi:hypothetical protein
MTMKRLPHSERAHLPDGKVSEELEVDLAEYPPVLFFPNAYWPTSDGLNGAAVEDPCTLYLNIPALSESFADGPAWSIDLEKVIFEMLDDFRTFGGAGALDEEGQRFAAALSSRLREIAAKVDIYLNPKAS